MAYASLSDLKLYRGIGTTSTSDDVLLTALLGRAQKQVESYCGRVFEAAVTATRSYDAIRDTSPDRRTLYLDDDLCEVTTITNGTAVEVTKYVTEPVNEAPYHAIRLKLSAGELFTYSSDPESAISVRGKWAYSTAAPADVVHATIRLAAYLYAQKDASVFDVTTFPDAGVMTLPQGMPRDVKIILEPYRRIR
jgi:hypothetical protein